MRLLVSAFRKGDSPMQNAQATQQLLAYLAVLSYDYQLCVGAYKGEREVSAQLTGFRTEEQAISLARRLIGMFHQECAVLVTNNVMCCVTAEGVTPIGLVQFAANQPDSDGYTQFLDGIYMWAAKDIRSSNLLKENHVL